MFYFRSMFPVWIEFYSEKYLCKCTHGHCTEISPKQNKLINHFFFMWYKKYIPSVSHAHTHIYKNDMCMCIYVRVYEIECVHARGRWRERGSARILLAHTCKRYILDNTHLQSLSCTLIDSHFIYTCTHLSLFLSQCLILYHMSPFHFLLVFSFCSLPSIKK